MKNKGFTLIELMVVMVVIGILAGLTLTGFAAARKTARDGQRKADLEQIRSALEMCRSDTGSYPGSLSFGGSLTCDGSTYMDSVPIDPINSSPYIYTYSGSANSYTLCANQLETTGVSYCVNNP